MLIFQKRLIGFDIGSDKIKWVIYEGSKKNPIIYKWGKITTPNEAVKYGRIIAKDKLKECLYPIIEENKPKVSGASLTFSCPEMIVRIIKLPKINKKELEQVVKYEIEQFIPVSASEYIIDYKLLGEFNEPEGKLLKVLVAAVPASIVRGYVELLEELNLKPEVIDFHGNSINRFLTMNNGNLQEKNYTILDLGYLTTTITIAEQGRPVFTRLIQNGNEEITSAIANSFNLSLNEAEKYLIDNGNLFPEIEAHREHLEKELFTSIKPVFDHILNDVFRSLEFYKSMNNNVVDGLVAVGGASLIKNSDKYAGEQLGLEMISYSENLSIKGLQDISIQEMPFLANVLGLVFHHKNDINLLPENYKKLKEEKRNRKYKTMGIVAIAILLAALVYFPRNMINELENKNMAIEQQIINKKEYEDLKKSEAKLEQKIKQRNDVIKSLQLGVLEWSEVVTQIGNIVPQGVAIKNLNYSDALEIAGQSESYKSFAQFIVNLQKINFISEVQPLSIVETSELYEFNLKCLVKGGNRENEAK